MLFISGLSEQEKLHVSDVLSTSRVHSETLETLLTDHSQQSASIREHAMHTFSEKYMVWISPLLQIVCDCVSIPWFSFSASSCDHGYHAALLMLTLVEYIFSRVIGFVLLLTYCNLFC